MSLTILVPFLIIVAFINVLLGAVILSRAMRSTSNILFGLISISTALWSVAIIGFYSPQYRGFMDWTIYTHTFALIIACLFFYFSAIFPKNQLSARPAIYLFSILPAIMSFFALYYFRSVVSSNESGELAYSIGSGYYGYTGTILFYFLGGYTHLFLQFKLKLDRVQKLQVRDVLIGSFFASAFAIVPDLILPTFNVFKFTWLGPVFTLILVFSIFVSIARHKLFSIRVIVTELFAGLIILIQIVQLFFSESVEVLVVNVIVLFLITLTSFLLVKGVYKEVFQREKIEVLAKDLAETNDRQEKLIHFIGHEVKGYLTKGEYAFAELAEGDLGQVPDSVKTLSQSALAELRKGVVAVTDILKAANLKRGTVTYEMKETDLKDAVLEEITKLEKSAIDKGLVLNKKINVNEAYLVNIDKVHFTEHVIRNLIDNSIKYTPSGSITIGLEKQPGKVIFYVLDTGVGINEEDKSRLFTEGGRGKDSIKVNVHSTGYGLYIARQIVHAHGGTIRGESAGPGKGSKFTIELPSK